MFTWSKASPIASARAPAPSSWLSAAFSLFRRSSPLSIVVDGERKSCASVVDFERLLADRVECPRERLDQLARRSPTQLCGSLRDCQQLIDKIDAGLERIKRKPLDINVVLESLQLPRGARDHGWGYLLRTLANYAPALDLYKVAALTKFRLYMTSVKSALIRAIMEAATLGSEKDSFIEADTKELVTIAPASTTRVPPQCVA